MRPKGQLAGKTKLATIHVPNKGIRLADAVDLLRSYEGRAGNARVRTNSEGDIVVFVDNWTV